MQHFGTFVTFMENLHIHLVPHCFARYNFNFTMSFSNNNELNDTVSANNASTARTGVGGRNKLNMQDYVAHKREMFMIKYSLNTKRDEIKKLDEDAQAREISLRQQEKVRYDDDKGYAQQLEDDLARFQSFLTENDMKSQEAAKQYVYMQADVA